MIRNALSRVHHERCTKDAFGANLSKEELASKCFRDASVPRFIAASLIYHDDWDRLVPFQPQPAGKCHRHYRALTGCTGNHPAVVFVTEPLAAFTAIGMACLVVQSYLTVSQGTIIFGVNFQAAQRPQYCYGAQHPWLGRFPFWMEKGYRVRTF